MADNKKAAQELQNKKELEEERNDLLDKCNQIFAKIRSDFNLRFPTDQYTQFNRQYATHMKKEFDLFAMCMEEVYQTYEVDGEKSMSAFLNNVLITIKSMLFTQLRCFLNYLDSSIQLNDGKSLSNWEMSEVQKQSRHKVKVMRGTTDEAIIQAQERNLIKDPTEELKQKLGINVDPLLREHQLSKKELLDALEEKRKNLSMRESKAGRYIKQQMRAIKSQIQEEKNFVNDFEEKYMQSLKKTIFQDAVSQAAGILEEITNNLDKNAKQKFMKVIEEIFAKAKEVLKKKSVGVQTVMLGNQIEESEGKMTKLNRKIYDNERSIEQFLKDVAAKDVKIVNLEKELFQLKNKSTAQDEASNMEEMHKIVDKLKKQLQEANSDKLFYQNKLAQMKSEEQVAQKNKKSQDKPKQTEAVLPNNVQNPLNDKKPLPQQYSMAETNNGDKNDNISQNMKSQQKLPSSKGITSRANSPHDLSTLQSPITSKISPNSQQQQQFFQDPNKNGISAEMLKQQNQQNEAYHKLQQQNEQLQQQMLMNQQLQQQKIQSLQQNLKQSQQQSESYLNTNRSTNLQSPHEMQEQEEIEDQSFQQLNAHENKSKGSSKAHSVQQKSKNKTKSNHVSQNQKEQTTISNSSQESKSLVSGNLQSNQQHQIVQSSDKLSHQNFQSNEISSQQTSNLNQQQQLQQQQQYQQQQYQQQQQQQQQLQQQQQQFQQQQQQQYQQQQQQLQLQQQQFMLQQKQQLQNQLQPQQKQQVVENGVFVDQSNLDPMKRENQLSTSQLDVLNQQRSKPNLQLDGQVSQQVLLQEEMEQPLDYLDQLNQIQQQQQQQQIPNFHPSEQFQSNQNYLQQISSQQQGPNSNYLEIQQTVQQQQQQQISQDFFQQQQQQNRYPSQGQIKYGNDLQALPQNNQGHFLPSFSSQQGDEKIDQQSNQDIQDSFNEFSKMIDQDAQGLIQPPQQIYSNKFLSNKQLQMVEQLNGSQPLLLGSNNFDGQQINTFGDLPLQEDQHQQQQQITFGGSTGIFSGSIGNNQSQQINQGYTTQNLSNHSSAKQKSNVNINEILDLFNLDHEPAEERQSVKIYEILHNKKNPKRREVINAIVKVINRGTSGEDLSNQHNLLFTDQAQKSGYASSGYTSFDQNNFKKTQSSLSSTATLGNLKSNNGYGSQFGETRDGSMGRYNKDQSGRSDFPSSSQSLNNFNRTKNGSLSNIGSPTSQLERIDQNPLENSINSTQNNKRGGSPQQGLMEQKSHRKYMTSVTFKEYGIPKRSTQNSSDHPINEEDPNTLNRIVHKQEVIQDIIKKKNQIAMSRFQAQQLDSSSLFSGDRNFKQQKNITMNTSNSQINLDSKRSPNHQSAWKPKEDFRMMENKTMLNYIQSVNSPSSISKIDAFDTNRKNTNPTKVPQIIKKPPPFHEDDHFVRDLYEHMKTGQIDLSKLKELDLQGNAPVKINQNAEIHPSMKTLNNGKVIDANNIGYSEFTEYYSDVLQQHRRCGPFCIHLKRFYEKLNFSIKAYEKRQAISCPTLVVQELQRDPNKQLAKFNLQSTQTNMSTQTKQ